MKNSNARGESLKFTIAKGAAKIASALVCGAVITGTAHAQTLTSNSTGTNNGYYYSFWKDNGDASMELLSGGRYRSRWSNSNNWVGGKGWNPGSNDRVISYSGTYSVDNSQNSYLALYGWTRNPLIEYYVIESYGSYNPSSCNGGTNYGTFQSDGATYNVRRCQRVNQPSIEGTRTFYQYFSVRTPKKGFGNISGTITARNHFNFWASKGLNLGSHDYMIMATEGYQSRGSSDITVSSGPIATPVPTPPPTSTGDIVVRMQGVTGDESVSLTIGGRTIQTWTLSTAMQSYGVDTNATGEIRVEFTNDSGDRDVTVDYINVDGSVRQAEDQEENTAAYDGECGGGSYTEMMHCNGYISFGPRSGGTASSAQAASSSSVVVITPPPTPTPPPTACTEMCKWYQDAPRPLCEKQNTGWGWENNRSCIGRDTCNNQYGDGGVISDCPVPQSSSSSSIWNPPSSSSSSSSSAAPVEELVVAINAGGGNVNYKGYTYQADKYALGGTDHATEDNISESDLFETERYGTYSYHVPVTNATYSLTLHFAEIFQEEPGARSFNVSVEGREELTAVDLYTLAGHDAAYTVEINNIRVNSVSRYRPGNTG